MADSDGLLVRKHVCLGVGCDQDRDRSGAESVPRRHGVHRQGVREDARLDPWCVVAHGSGEWILFGFALHHMTLAGLAWMTTSPIRYLNPSTGTARLANGRRYGLGRQFRPSGVAAEGLEACLALELLLRDSAAPDETIPRMSCNPDTDQRWVSSCKMARHLAVGPPLRDAAAIQTFHDMHGQAFATLIAARRT